MGCFYHGVRDCATGNSGATGRAGLIAHCGRAGRDGNFGVTDGGGVVAMHADGMGPELRAVRTVQAAQPVETDCGALSQGVAEGVAAGALRAGFVIAGRSPDVRFPWMVLLVDAL